MVNWIMVIITERTSTWERGTVGGATWMYPSRMNGSGYREGRISVYYILYTIKEAGRQQLGWTRSRSNTVFETIETGSVSAPDIRTPYIDRAEQPRCTCRQYNMYNINATLLTWVVTQLCTVHGPSLHVMLEYVSMVRALILQLASRYKKIVVIRYL